MTPDEFPARGILLASALGMLLWVAFFVLARAPLKAKALEATRARDAAQVALADSSRAWLERETALEARIDSLRAEGERLRESASRASEAATQLRRDADAAFATNDTMGGIAMLMLAHDSAASAYASCSLALTSCEEREEALRNVIALRDARIDLGDSLQASTQAEADLWRKAARRGLLERGLPVGLGVLLVLALVLR